MHTSDSGIHSQIENLHRLRAIVAATSDIISIVNYKGQVVPTFRTGDWQEFTGQSFEEVLNGGYKKAIHEHDMEHVEAATHRIMSGTSVDTLEYRLRRRDGEWRWIFAKVVPVFDENGQVLEWIWAMKDITDTKCIEAEKDVLISQLQEREKRLANREDELNKALEELNITHQYIKERERQISAVVNTTQDVILSVDRELRFTTMNKAYENLLWTLFKKKAQIGGSVLEMVPDEEKEEFGALLDQVLEGESVQRIKRWNHDNYAEEFFEPIRNEDQKVIGVAMFSRDISQKRQVDEQLLQSLEEEKKLNEELALREHELEAREQELRESFKELSTIYRRLVKSESKFEAISTCTNDAIYDWDIENDFLDWSPGFIQMFGLENSEIKRYNYKMWEDCVHPEDLDGTVSSLNEAIKGTQSTWAYNYRIIRSDGKVVHIAEKGQIMRDNKGGAVRMVGGLRDVTERNLASENIQKSENFLNSVIDNMPIGVLVVDKKGYVTRMNRQYKESLGLSSDLTVSGHFNILEDNFSIESNLVKYLVKVLQGEIMVNEEIYVDFGSPFNNWSARRDKAWFAFTMFPILENGEVSCIISVAHEITEDKLNQEKIRENTVQIIETNKKMAEYRLMALRSVMNPHFLFNSLNSIQSFVATNEKEQAINYLSLFSKLIRSILNSSIENYTTLADEIDLLKLYVNLEKLRFKDKFDVKFLMDKDLDPDDIEVPSLILQPFVENAILHGLYNKKENDGLLSLDFRLLDDRLLCVIEDNGIGRDEAKKIKAANKMYKSVGMLVTQERLDLVNRDSTLSVEILDLKDQNQALGTRVQVLIDLK